MIARSGDEHPPRRHGDTEKIEGERVMGKTIYHSGHRGTQREDRGKKGLPRIYADKCGSGNRKDLNRKNAEADRVIRQLPELPKFAEIGKP
jgi:hypothetical protein